MNSNKTYLLHIEDELLWQEQVAAWLEPDWHVVAIDELPREECDGLDFEVCILDINLGEGDVTSVRRSIDFLRQKWPDIGILIFSHMDVDSVLVQCMAWGADDFCTKQLDRAEFVGRVAGLRDAVRQRRASDRLTQMQSPCPAAGRTIKKIWSRIPQLLESAVTSIYVEGEPGTGKEVVVDLIEHFLKPSQPLVRINCGALSSSLVESELFGHRKGAFTGATAENIGLIARADNGFLFLDEVASLSPAAQAGLLRVIENQEVRPVGYTEARRVNVRFIAASNVALNKAVAEGSFRQDLWSRLREVEIKIPPLRQRPEEIDDLARYLAREMAGGPFEVNSDVLRILRKASWKTGNVRELRNCLRTMSEHARGKLLGLWAVPNWLWEEMADVHEQGKPTSEHERDEEDDLLAALLTRAKVPSGRLSLRALAAELGVSKSHLHRRLTAWSVQHPELRLLFQSRL